MQPYFDPTRRKMEDNLKYLKKEDYLICFQMEDDLNFGLGNL